MQPVLKIFLPVLKVLLTCSLVQCSRTCGKGWRKRAVSCKSTNPSARAQLLHDAACSAESKPRTHEVCLLKRCHKHKKLQWLVSAWSQVCSSDPLRMGSASSLQTACFCLLYLHCVFSHCPSSVSDASSQSPLSVIASDHLLHWHPCQSPVTSSPPSQ